MSAICLNTQSGIYYTKDYDSPKEVQAAIERGEELECFWFATWGRRYQETFIFRPDIVGLMYTEREIP